MSGPTYRDSSAILQKQIHKLARRWAVHQAQLTEHVRAALPQPLRAKLDDHLEQLKLAATGPDPRRHLDALEALSTFCDGELASALPAAEAASWRIPEGISGQDIHEEPFRWTPEPAAVAHASPVGSTIRDMERMIEDCASSSRFSHGQGIGSYISAETGEAVETAIECWRLRAEAVVEGHTLGLTLWCGISFDDVPTEVRADALLAMGVPEMHIAPESLLHRLVHKPLKLKRDATIGDPEFDRAYLVDADDHTARSVIVDRVRKGLIELAIWTPAVLSIRQQVATLYWPVGPRVPALKAIFEVLVGLRETGPLERRD